MAQRAIASSLPSILPRGATAPSVSSRASSTLPSKMFPNHIVDNAESFGNRVKKGSVRKFNFASSQYASCFKDLPKPDVAKLRKDAVEYLDSFDGKSWYDDPICSILNGEKLLAPPSNLWITKNSLSQPNGHQYYSTPTQVQSILTHIQTYKSPYKDIRPQIRRIEQKFLHEYDGFLIGNQCLDFGKQDGVTEIEESIMANSVERKLNDLLLDEEIAGKVVVNRQPIFVSCVSNFTNFLDLFRKTLRSLELGIPCVVLGRSHTVQHSYRWTELLVDLMKEEELDLGMVTYLSAQLEDIKYVTSESVNEAGMLYTTCSRQLAKDIKSTYPKTIASTGGPNTLFTTEWTKQVQDAIRMSASIECAGQCTALRHAVVPETVKPEDVEAMFNDVTHVTSSVEALRQSAFDGVFAQHGGTSPPSSKSSDGAYIKHSTKDAYYKVSSSLPAPENGELEEYWRKVVVDVTTSAPNTPSHSEKKAKLQELAKWLIRHQPISLAVNAPRSQVFDLGRDLFETTSLVVTTIGSTDKDDAPPALSCQARPQEAECFGEFPPRKTMGVFTEYPMIIPSSNPSYDTHYQRSYLESHTGEVNGKVLPFVKDLLMDISDAAVRGYCVEILNYLIDATKENPKRGFGSDRTAIWGLQRPPMLEEYRSLIRVGAGVTLDDIAPIFLLFNATNASSQVEFSVDASNEELIDILPKYGLVLKLKIEDEDSFDQRVDHDGDNYYNVVKVPQSSDGEVTKFPLPGQFVSLYLPMGHIKSTMKNDEEFVKYFGKSEKWLKMA